MRCLNLIVFMVVSAAMAGSAFCADVQSQQVEKLALWYDMPAAGWESALPVGNGLLGGMIFGGIEQEKIQFNEQALWDGDESKMGGSYQPFGELFIADSTQHTDVGASRRPLLSEARP